MLDWDGERSIPATDFPAATSPTYLAFFSVLILPAPFALGAGLWARRDLRRRPDRRGRGRANFAIVMGGLFTLAPFILILVFFILERFKGD